MTPILPQFFHSGIPVEKCGISTFHRAYIGVEVENSSTARRTSHEERILYLAPGRQIGIFIAEPSGTSPKPATGRTGAATGQAEQVQTASPSNSSSDPE